MRGKKSRENRMAEIGEREGKEGNRREQRGREARK
jgi:hypothetical protein